MLISPVKSYYNNPYSKALEPEKKASENKEPANIKNQMYSVSFNGNSIVNLLGKSNDFKKFIHSTGKVSIEEYNQIKKNNPELIQQARTYIKTHNIMDNVIQSPKDTAKLAIKIKELFDNVFGDDNYVILSVGTSPAFVTEPLEAMGEKVIFVPVSKVGITPLEQDVNDYFKLYPRAKIIAEYIKENLDNCDIKDDTKILVMDYSSTGTTFMLMREILSQYCNVGNENMRKCEIAQIIRDIYDKDYFRLNPESYIIDIDEQRIEKVTNIPHYDITYDGKFNGLNKPHLFNTEKEKKDYENLGAYSRAFARAFQLVVLDEIHSIEK